MFGKIFFKNISILSIVQSTQKARQMNSYTENSDPWLQPRWKVKRRRRNKRRGRICIWDSRELWVGRLRLLSHCSPILPKNSVFAAGSQVCRLFCVSFHFPAVSSSPVLITAATHFLLQSVRTNPPRRQNTLLLFVHFRQNANFTYTLFCSWESLASAVSLYYVLYYWLLKCFFYFQSSNSQWSVLSSQFSQLKKTQDRVLWVLSSPFYSITNILTKIHFQKIVILSNLTKSISIIFSQVALN